MTDADSTHFAQTGVMHINGNPNAQYFTEYCGGCSSSTRDFWGTASSGTYDYEVYRASGGGYYDAIFGRGSVTLPVSFSPYNILSYAEVLLYQPGTTNYGDAGMGDKSNYIASSNVQWIDSSYYNHNASLGWDNRTATPYQNYHIVNSNNWSTWDSRCG